MKPTLLVLAAGMGSRYGGVKQIDAVGPSGEAILDYSVFDAVRAGFEDVVFIIRKDIEEDFRRVVGSRVEPHLPVDYVFQELDDLPDGFKVPADRGKPWGTGHAVLRAADVITRPFAVINADDFYGRVAFSAASEFLTAVDPASNNYCIIGYRLGETLSTHGTVSRGVCKVSDGMLAGIEEHTRIGWDGDRIVSTANEAEPVAFTTDTPVSMNFFGFTPAVFGQLDEHFRAFLNESIDEPKSEFFIPKPLNQLIATGAASCRVIEAGSDWFGVTYREDKPRVQQSIRSLVDRGDYPEQLWT